MTVFLSLLKFVICTLIADTRYVIVLFSCLLMRLAGSVTD